MSLRMACSHAQRLVTQCAAALAGVDPAAVSVHDGAFLAGGRELGTYWSLARYVDLAVPVEPPPGNEAAPPEAGWSEPALGLADKMHGRYGFIHDLSLPDMLHGRMLRPPSIGARLARLDLAAVRSEEHTSELQSLMRI